MQVFIVGSIYNTVMVLDKKRRHKQWVEIQQIIDAIDGNKAWKNHPCTIQYREHKNWLLLYRTVIEYVNMDMHEKAMGMSLIAESWRPKWHTQEYFDQMKRRLYTKNPNHYKQWSDLGESEVNWYFVDNEWRYYNNGKRI